MSYGAIVEAAHSHGFSSSNPSQHTVSGATDSQSSYQGHSDRNECSLCQFQRQLFGGLAPVILVAHTAQYFAVLSQETISYLSTSALPTLGRAPPLFWAQFSNCRSSAWLVCRNTDFKRLRFGWACLASHRSN